MADLSQGSPTTGLPLADLATARRLLTEAQILFAQADLSGEFKNAAAVAYSASLVAANMCQRVAHEVPDATGLCAATMSTVDSARQSSDDADKAIDRNVARTAASAALTAAETAIGYADQAQQLPKPWNWKPFLFFVGGFAAGGFALDVYQGWLARKYPRKY
jgi:hypothetical protein